MYHLGTSIQTSVKNEHNLLQTLAEHFTISRDEKKIWHLEHAQNKLHKAEIWPKVCM